MTRVLVVVVWLPVAVFGLAGCGKDDGGKQPADGPASTAGTKDEKSPAVKKAREFLKAGMFREATAALDAEVQNSPTDVGLHLLLAEAHLGGGDLRSAEESFKRVVRLDGSRAKSIGALCSQAGRDALHDGVPERASLLFQLAIKYDSETRPGIAVTYCDVALDTIKKADVEGGERLLRVAAEIDGASVLKVGPAVGAAFLTEGRSAFAAQNETRARTCFPLAVKYDASLKADIAAILTDAAALKIAAGDIGTAGELLAGAESYDAAFVTKSGARLGKLYLSQAQRLSDAGNTELAKTCFSFAVKRDDLLKGQIAEFLANGATRKVEAGDLVAAAELVGAAVTYDTGAGAKVGMRALEKAKDIGSPATNWAKINEHVEFGVRHNPARKVEGGDLLWSLLLQHRVPATVGQLVPLAERAVSLNPDLRTKTSAMLTDLAEKGIGIDRLEVQNVTILCRAAVQIDRPAGARVAAAILTAVRMRLQRPKAAETEWTDLSGLIKLAGEFASQPSDDTAPLGDQAVQIATDTAGRVPPSESVWLARIAVFWKPSAAASSTQFLLDNGGKAISSEPIDVASAGIFFDGAIAVTPDSRGPAAKLVVSEMSKRSENLRAIGQVRYFALIDLSERLATTDEFRGTSAYRLGQALKAYMNGSNAFAVPALQELARKDGSSFEGRAAASILSRPPSRKLDISNLPTRGVDFMIVVRPRVLEIRDNTVELTLEFSSDGVRYMYWPRATWKSEKVGTQGMVYEGIHLVDENGNKQFANNFTFSVPVEKYNNLYDAAANANVMVIPVRKNGGLTAKVSFPLPTAGARSVRLFVPPDQDGGGNWSLDKIAVKPSPFEEVPPSLPAGPAGAGPANNGGNAALKVNDPVEPDNRGLGVLQKAELEKWDKAITDYTAGIRANPNDALGYGNRANAFRNRGLVSGDGRDYERAVADFTSAIRLNPRAAGLYNNRGGAFFLKGDMDKAIADYNEAIRLNPKYANAYANRGMAFSSKGTYERAAADWTESLRFDPKNTAAAKSLAWLFATCPDAKYRDGKKAVQYATTACELAQWK